MKRTLSLFVCLLLGYSLLAQGKYPIPPLGSEEKHVRAVSQAWVIAAAGINYAKTKGTTPYEYGKYLGNLFAPSWGQGNDFDTFVRGSIFNFESFRDDTDSPLQIKENSDGSVTIVTADMMWHKYFPDGSPFVSYSEFLELIKGLNEPIADHMGGTVTMESRDGHLMFTYRKK
jgi:hypothetical protein